MKSKVRDLHLAVISSDIKQSEFVNVPEITHLGFTDKPTSSVYMQLQSQYFSPTPYFNKVMHPKLMH